MAITGTAPKNKKSKTPGKTISFVGVDGLYSDFPALKSGNPPLAVLIL